MTGWRAAFVIALATLVPACAGAPASRPPDAAPASVVRAFVGAFNAHDVDTMLALVASDVAWYGVEGATVTTETAGRDALAGAMRAYFASLPTARSQIVDLMTAGRFVTVDERASWDVKGKSRSQHALAVYEIDAGRIRNVWYFASQR